MGIKFNADEIFEMAEQMERNGAKFYNKAAEASAAARSRELLRDLAAMEVVHEKTFADMRTELSGKERAATVFDPDDVAASYLQAFADGHVFNVNQDPSELLTGREKMEEILERAIGLERDSIAFYMGIRESVPENLGRDNIDGIIREEMKHVTTLSRELAAL
jgi:rubrerythrin